MTSEQLIEFWFGDDVKKRWFKSTAEFDQQLRDLFENLWQQARDNQLADWKHSASGCLALTILFDQMPLNMYRGQAASFSTEALARDVSHHAIKKDFHRQFDEEKQAFLYMPFMHSENLNDQKYAIELFKLIGREDNLRFARHHHDIVKRFGRFPHRNHILGRESTADELAYLESDQAFTG